MRKVSEILVSFRDTDMYGHANHAVYLSWLEEGRIAFWKQLFGTEAFDRMPMVVGEMTIRYERPTFFDQKLDVCLDVGELRRRSFDMHYELRDQASGERVASAKSAQVLFNVKTEQTYTIPDEFRAALEGWRQSAR